MFSRRNRILGVLAGLGDLAVVALAFQVAYLIRLNLPLPRPFFLPPATSGLLLVSALAIWWISGATLGVYRRVETHDFLQVAKATLKQTVVASVGFISWLYLLKEEDRKSVV